MSRFTRNLALFMAGLPILPGKLLGAAPSTSADNANVPATEKPVSLRPLNLEADNLFAGHRSHSSHRSHASHSSHYSGSSGSSYTPSPAPAPALAPSPPSSAPYLSPPGSYLTAPPSPAPTPSGRSTRTPGATKSSTTPGGASDSLSSSEKLKLQIVRVQIKLKTLGLYGGAVDGVFREDTQRALREFQLVKGIEATGLMTTPTLNALGVPAVN